MLDLCPDCYKMNETPSICEHFRAVLEPICSLKYDCNIILLVRGTAETSVQNKDPSAVWSVAREATGGLLNEASDVSKQHQNTQKDVDWLDTEISVILIAHIW